MFYALTQDPNIVVRSDGFFIERSNESDWGLYEAWCRCKSEGNISRPAELVAHSLEEEQQAEINEAMRSANIPLIE